jgi:glycosyltransferase involved in cell wall biosynthesis
MNKLDFSVVVCCYRGESTIKMCLNSLIQQNYSKSKYEIIIVNDGSIDNSLKIIKSVIRNNNDKNLKIKLIDKNNAGLSLARNSGLNMARGDIIVYIDEDAVAEKNYLKEIDNAFNKNESINCVGGAVELLNKDNRFASFLHYSIFNWYMRSPETVIGTNMAFKKAFLDALGGFIPEFTRRGDESAFFAKAGKMLKIYITGKAVVYHLQPYKMISWLKTRRENGYYSAIISKLLKKEVSPLIFYIRSFFIFLHLVLIPILLLISVCAPNILILFLSIYILMIVKRYFYSNSILGPIFLLKNNKARSNNNIEYLYLPLIIILGCFYSDYGHIHATINLIGKNYNDYFTDNK